MAGRWGQDEEKAPNRNCSDAEPARLGGVSLVATNAIYLDRMLSIPRYACTWISD